MTAFIAEPNAIRLSIVVGAAPPALIELNTAAICVGRSDACSAASSARLDSRLIAACSVASSRPSDSPAL